MVLKVKLKFNLYKRFEQDIWGILFSLLNTNISLNGLYNYSRILYFFYSIFLKKNQKFKIRYIYRIDIIRPEKQKIYLKKRFITLRLIKCYYICLSYKRLKNLSIIAAKLDGNFESNYCYLLECRLFPFIYRTTFFINLFFILEILKNNIVILNNKLVNNENLLIKVGDVINIIKPYHSIIKFNFIRRFHYGNILFNSPRFIFINYKLLMCILLYKPGIADLVFPFKMNILRVTGFY